MAPAGEGGEGYVRELGSVEAVNGGEGGGGVLGV